MEKVEDKKFFVSEDLYLAAGISLLMKLSPLFEMRGDRVVFTFEASDDLYRAVNAFNSGAPGDLCGYSRLVRSFRARVYETKNKARIE